MKALGNIKFIFTIQKILTGEGMCSSWHSVAGPFNIDGGIHGHYIQKIQVPLKKFYPGLIGTICNAFHFGQVFSFIFSQHKSICNEAGIIPSFFGILLIGLNG